MPEQSLQRGWSLIMSCLMIEFFVFAKDNMVWLYFSQIILKYKSCGYAKICLNSSDIYYSFNLDKLGKILLKCLEGNQLIC